MGSWIFGVLVDPAIDLSVALKRVRGRDEADQRQTEVVPISRALGPSFDLLVSFQVVPCLSAGFVQEPPLLDVSRFFFTNRGYSRAVLVFVVAVGVAVQDRLLSPCHLRSSRGTKIGLDGLGGFMFITFFEREFVSRGLVEQASTRVCKYELRC